MSKALCLPAVCGKRLPVGASRKRRSKTMKAESGRVTFCWLWKFPTKKWWREPRKFSDTTAPMTLRQAKLDCLDLHRLRQSLRLGVAFQFLISVCGEEVSLA